MSKKKAEKFAAYKPKYVEGMIKAGAKEEDALDFWEQLLEFSKYAFNRSHAAAYALLSYWTGWLKYHYPAEFLAEAMNWAGDDEDVKGLIREARHFGIEMLAPDINKSDSGFSVQDGKIIFGLGSIKDVGETGNMILADRTANGPYASLKDFFLRTQVKKNAAENLIKAGALDMYCDNRQAMLAVIKPYKDAGKKYMEKAQWVKDAEKIDAYIDACDTEEGLEAVQKELNVAVLDKPTTRAMWERKLNTAREAEERLLRELNNIMIPVDVEEDVTVRLNEEHEILGSYITGNPLHFYPNPEDIGATPIGQVDGKTKRIMGIITAITLKNRARDMKSMAFLTVEDLTGTIEVKVFADYYDNCVKSLKESNVVVIEGRSFEEESALTDDEGMPIRKMAFMATSMEEARIERKVMISVPLYATFHVDSEKEFKDKYADKNGCKLLIHEAMTGKARVAMYRVNEAVLELPNAVEL